jgi:hypothetical protein
MATYELSFSASILSQISSVAGYGYEASFSADIRSALSSEVFNFSQWTRENVAPKSIYTAKLEQPDGTLLLDLRLKNFQAKINKDALSYLSVVCSNEDDFSDIESWISSGSVFLVVRKAMVVGGVISFSEIIARVECDTPRMDRGASSASVSISGYWAEDFSPKIVVLPSPSIKRTIGGRFVMTFPEPDLYLRPGDTIKVPEEVDLIVGAVSYTVNGDMMSMTVSEEKAL